MSKLLHNQRHTETALKQSQKLLCEIVEREADGTAVVEMAGTVVKQAITTRQRNRDGEPVELFYVSPDAVPAVMRVWVPPGEDVFTYLNDSPETDEFLQQRIGEIGQETPRSEAVYEIVGQQPDGSTLLRSERLWFTSEVRVKECVRDGKTVEQYYELVIPQRECTTVELSPGQDIVEYLRQKHGLEEDSIPDAPAPHASEDYGEVIPDPPPPGC